MVLKKGDQIYNISNHSSKSCPRKDHTEHTSNSKRSVLNSPPTRIVTIHGNAHDQEHSDIAEEEVSTASNVTGSGSKNTSARSSTNTINEIVSLRTTKNQTEMTIKAFVAKELFPKVISQ